MDEVGDGRGLGYIRAGIGMRLVAGILLEREVEDGWKEPDWIRRLWISNSGVPFTTGIVSLEGWVELALDWSLVGAVMEDSLVSAMGPQ